MEYISTLAVLVLVFNAIFVLSVILKNNSIVDIFWGLGFIIASIYTYWAYGAGIEQQLLITGLVTIWGLRLSGRILLRNWKKPEDWRYKKWRKEWDPSWFYLRSYLQVFMLQALLCFTIILPVIFVNSTLTFATEWLLFIGLTVWIFGFLFEVVGDWQLDQFMKRKNRKKNELLTNGLWKYSRHPNYFGEATLWWGVWIIAMSVSFAAWWTVIAPLTITVLLLKISGVPILEEKMMKNPNFKDYASQTNKFIPGPPKKAGAKTS